MVEKLNPYSKPSIEEQELWWKEGMKGENFRRLYNARIAKREAWNNQNGITTTYKSEESNLPEIVITAPKETEKQRLAKEQKRKLEKENLIDLGLTVAGFVPGLDTAADIADIGNSFRKGDYSGMLWGIAGLGLPIAGKTLKSGWNLLKNAYVARLFLKSPLKSINITKQPISTSIKYIPSHNKTKGKTSLLMLLRPKSKISDAELAGIPKGERNNPIKENVYRKTNAQKSIYLGGATDNRNIPYPNPSGEYVDNMQRSNEIALKNFNDRHEQVLKRALKDDDIIKFNELLKEYIQQLPEADKMFFNTNGFLSAYIQDFRKYLYNLGLDAGDILDVDLAKIISLQYHDLTNSMTGKAKGMIVWHGSDLLFDLFDISKTGNWSENMGYGGPGVYFSNARTPYGRNKNLGILNMQPYLINKVQSTPNISVMLEKGLLPNYVSPKDMDFESYKKHLSELIELTPINDNKLYIDDVSMFPRSSLSPKNGEQSEYLLRRNFGIKSLFPHPSLFKRDNNGKIRIIRDWNDPRINYKKGGKLK